MITKIIVAIKIFFTINMVTERNDDLVISNKVFRMS